MKILYISNTLFLFMVTRYEIWAKGYTVPNYDPSQYRKDECGVIYQPLPDYYKLVS